tara:strand:- start:268 stop:480 length:213 start_codon:yes stop_codon:yes gene_type:complete
MSKIQYIEQEFDYNYQIPGVASVNMNVTESGAVFVQEFSNQNTSNENGLEFDEALNYALKKHAELCRRLA